jgi:hypothetical protein
MDDWERGVERFTLTSCLPTAPWLDSHMEDGGGDDADVATELHVVWSCGTREGLETWKAGGMPVEKPVATVLKALVALGATDSPPGISKEWQARGWEEDAAADKDSNVKGASAVGGGGGSRSDAGKRWCAVANNAGVFSQSS